MKVFGKWLLVYKLILSFTLAAPCQVKLLNGDTFLGDYKGQAGSYAQFKVPWQSELVRVHGKFIDGIIFSHSGGRPSGEWVLSFGSDQQIYADIIQMTPDFLQVKTEWVDHLTLNPSFLEKVTRAIPIQNIYLEGPDLPMKWNISNSKVVHHTDPFLGHDPFASRSLRSSGRIQQSATGWMMNGNVEIRTVLPKVTGSFGLKITLGIPDDLNAVNFSLSVAALPQVIEGKNNPFENVIFRANQDVLYFIKNSQQMGFIPFRGEDGDAQVRNDKDLSLLLAFDATKNIYQVKVNGDIIESWGGENDTAYEQLISPNLNFKNIDEGSQVILKEVLYYALEEELSLNPSTWPSDEQYLMFKNGDYLTGQWRGFNPEGEWLWGMDGMPEPLSVDHSRIQGWQSNLTNRIALRMKNNHVRVSLNGGLERFVAELVSSTSKGLFLNREDWKLEFFLPYDRIEQIDFNPYFRH